MERMKTLSATQRRVADEKRKLAELAAENAKLKEELAAKNSKSCAIL